MSPDDKRRTSIHPDTALKIWRILIEECGCKDSHSQQSEFLHYLANDVKWIGHEFRFIGLLGFGGKFYNDGFRWIVTCYPEDRTPEREAMIRITNDRLAALRQKYTAEQ